MRIAIVTYVLQIGGVEAVLKLLADYFREHGHDADIIESLAVGSWSRSFIDEGYSVIRSLPSPFRSCYWHANKIKSVLRKYDVVIVDDACIALAVLGKLPESTITIAHQ